MRLLISFSALDIWTTIIGSRLGLIDTSPLVRQATALGRWDTLIAGKLMLVLLLGLSSFPIPQPWRRRLLLPMTLVTAAACAWNAAWILTAV